LKPTRLMPAGAITRQIDTAGGEPLFFSHSFLH